MLKSIIESVLPLSSELLITIDGPRSFSRPVFNIIAIKIAYGAITHLAFTLRLILPPHAFIMRTVWPE
jgi:hypothetical protein